MNKLESNSGQAVMEESKNNQPAQIKQFEGSFNLDSIPFEDFIFQVEEAIFLEERNKNNDNVSYLEKCLEKMKEKKKIFLEEIESEERRFFAEVYFEIEEVVIKNLIERKIGDRSEEFRIEDAKWQLEIIFLINKIKNDPTKIRMFWDEYKTIFNYEDDIKSGNKYMAGILAPMALQNILTEKYGLEVTYPKPKEDVKYSVDMVAVDDKSRKIFLIQVKTDKEQIEKIIKRDLNASKNGLEINSDANQGNGKELIKVIPRFEFGDGGGEMLEEYQIFSRGCLKYVENNRNLFENKQYETKGVYIYVPYVVGGEKLIDMNGIPHEKLWKILVAEKLETKLGLPKKFNYDNL